MLRLFLPAMIDGDRTPWSALLPAGEELQAASEFPWPSDSAPRGSIQPPVGDLDEAIAEALRDCMGQLSMSALTWTGYESTPSATDCLVEMNGLRFRVGPLERDAIRAGIRPPSFAWDDGGQFAWGSLPYPDSLVVAADLSRFRRLFENPLLEKVSVVADRHHLPPSAGD